MSHFLLAGAPGAEAVYDAATKRSYTFGELGDRVSGAVERLGPERRLAFLFCRNDVPSLALYLACLEARHPVLLLDGALADEARRHLVDCYRPDLILSSTATTVDEAGYARRVHDDLGIAVAEREAPAGHTLHAELALLLPTSGSTGSPKLVRLSRGNVAANAHSIREGLGIHAGERPITSLPIHYSYGLSVVNSHFVAGAPIVMTDESIMLDGFWKLAREQSCTSMAGVPYLYQLLRRLGFEKRAPDSMLTLTQAGGRLAPEHVAFFHEIMTRRGGKFFVMYGQTEATARIAILPADRLPEKLGSAGQAIPGGRITIDAGGAETTEPRREGEVVYEGPNVMLGYAERAEDLALGDVNAGRLRTGDLGYLDDEGFLFITGRAKRISKVFGYRISLDDVERLLRDVGPVAVVGTDERIYVFCEGAEDLDTVAIRQRAAASLGVQLSVFEVRRIERLPLMSSGKVNYGELQKSI